MRRALKTSVAAVCLTALATPPELALAANAPPHAPAAHAPPAKSPGPQPAAVKPSAASSNAHAAAGAAHAAAATPHVAAATPAAGAPAAPVTALARAGEGAARDGRQVAVGSADGFTHLEFRSARAAEQRGDTVVVRLPAAARGELTQLLVTPPAGLKSAVAAEGGGGLLLTLTPADDHLARIGRADGALFVNLLPKPKVEPPAPSKVEVVEAARARPNPTPAGGAVHMGAELDGGLLRLRFPWAAPLGAAVFRRGGAVFVVFDHAAKLDLSAAPSGLRQMSKAEVVPAATAAVRLRVPAETPVSVAAEGGTWTLTLGAGQSSGGVSVTRDQPGQGEGLTARLAGATATVWLTDPGVGDRIAAVTALGPAKGLGEPRSFVDLDLPPTLQGLVVAPRAEGVDVAADGDLVRISRAGAAGLSLSPAWVKPDEGVEAALSLPAPASMPGLIDPRWMEAPKEGFLTRYAALQKAAAAEVEAAEGDPAGGATAARMGLARFLVGQQLSFEAIGILNNLMRQRPAMAADAEFRGLRGAARVMAGRRAEAETDLAVPIVSDDPASALWRSLAASQAGRYGEAVEQYGRGRAALEPMPKLWRTRIATGAARALLETGDLSGAQQAISTAVAAADTPEEVLAARLVQAAVFQAEGRLQGALNVYKAVARAPIDQLAAPARLHATELGQQLGQVTPADAAKTFDSLRYRWRGDATELDVIRALGRLYLQQGRYREALEALRSAGQRLPDLPAAGQLQQELSQAFRSLFLDGGVDGLQPIQALGLFYDFRELTPVGADGDMIVRKLARRLVDVDLLEPAAKLLQYQAFERLEGVARAQVATDLATIRLMNRQPEQALQALNESRTTLLPAALNAERRLVEARALMGLNRLEHADEVLAGDNGGDAQAIRAEVAWRRKDWPLAGRLLEASLGQRFASPLPLTPEEESRLLRTGVAYSLAADDGALARLRGRYGALAAKGRAPEAMQVALAGVDGGALSAGDFTRAVSEDEMFAGWVSRMKQRFRDDAGATRVAAAKPTAGAAKG